MPGGGLSFQFPQLRVGFPDDHRGLVRNRNERRAVTRCRSSITGGPAVPGPPCTRPVHAALACGSCTEPARRRLSSCRTALYLGYRGATSSQLAPRLLGRISLVATRIGALHFSACCSIHLRFLAVVRFGLCAAYSMLVQRPCLYFPLHKKHAMFCS